MSNQAINTASELQALDGERGIPSVNHVGGPSTKKRALVLLVIALVAAVAGGVGYWKIKKQQDRDAASAEAKTMRVTSAVPERTFTEPPQKEVVPPLPDQQASAAKAVPAVASTTTQAMPAAHQAQPSLDKSASSLMVASTSKRSADTQEPGTNPQQTAPQEQGSMAAMLASTKTATRKASNLGNRNFLLAKGAFIDCALQTKLDSTVPGMTACVVTRNIYSDNGKVLLIERGSTVSGEYQSNMKQGMARIFVLWNRIKTPTGVVVDLDSPGTDPLGGSGLPGYIDTHFWQRFGGALMLSLVDDVARGLTAQTSGNGNQFNFNSTSEATQNMAAEALRNTINIPPTLYKNQGEQIGIYIARDLDFSNVYDVAAQ